MIVMYCIGTANTTGQPCRQRALPGGRYCQHHALGGESPECVGGPLDGECVQRSPMGRCHRRIAVTAGFDVYRADRPLEAPVIGFYELMYTGSALVWCWELEDAAVEAWR